MLRFTHNALHLFLKLWQAMEITTNIYLGDCKEQLVNLSDNSVDLIVTSPPYADQ